MGINTIYLNLKAWYGRFKDKYDVKSIKLILLILLLVVGTIFCVRKNKKDNPGIVSYLQDNLPITRGFKFIGVKAVTIDSASLKFLKSKVTSNSNTDLLKQYKAINSYYRIDDTLYSAFMFVDLNGKVVAMKSYAKISAN